MACDPPASPRWSSASAEPRCFSRPAALRAPALRRPAVRHRRLRPRRSAVPSESSSASASGPSSADELGVIDPSTLPVTIPFDYVANHPVVETGFGTAETFPMILDTGAPVNVSADLVKKFGFPVVGQQTGAAAGGTVTSDTGRRGHGDHGGPHGVDGRGHHPVGRQGEPAVVHLRERPGRVERDEGRRVADRLPSQDGDCDRIHRRHRSRDRRHPRAVPDTRRHP